MSVLCWWAHAGSDADMDQDDAAIPRALVSEEVHSQPSVQEPPFYQRQHHATGNWTDVKSANSILWDSQNRRENTSYVRGTWILMGCMEGSGNLNQDSQERPCWWRHFSRELREGRCLIEKLRAQKDAGVFAEHWEVQCGWGKWKGKKNARQP
jgi:hypothetical protein